MTVSDFKIVWVPVLRKRDFSFGNKSTRVIHIYQWFYKSYVSPLIIIIFTKFVHIIILWAQCMINSLI